MLPLEKGAELHRLPWRPRRPRVLVRQNVLRTQPENQAGSNRGNRAGVALPPPIPIRPLLLLFRPQPNPVGAAERAAWTKNRQSAPAVRAPPALCRRPVAPQGDRQNPGSERALGQYRLSPSPPVPLARAQRYIAHMRIASARPVRRTRPSLRLPGQAHGRAGTRQRRGTGNPVR